VGFGHLTRRDWICLFGGPYLIFESIRGLKTGSATLFYRTVTRSEEGYLYWFALTLCALAGIGGLLAVIYEVVKS